MADAPAAPQSAPAAPASDVPINQNPPASAPNPVGSQAPPAPTGEVKGSEHRPMSRRETIQAAFERASKSQPPEAKGAQKATPGPADAKIGHNKPPEKLDLRKRPTEQPRERGEHGHFVPREKPEQAGPQGVTQQPGLPPGRAGERIQAPTQPARQPPPPLPQNAPYREPPVRMSDEARADWPATPETVRGDIHRVQQEFAKAYNLYKSDHDAMQPIRHFQKMAIDHGTTLEQALTNYVSMENKLRTDTIAGLELIVHNLGLKTPQGQPLTLRDVAYHVMTQTPDQLRAVQLGNNQQATQHQLGALMQQVSDLKNSVDQLHIQNQYRQTRPVVDQFADTHPRFDELGPQISAEIAHGYDLETAYRRADLLNPTTQAAQTRTTSAQTRQADKSIHGAPGPSNGAERRPKEPSATARDAAANAISRYRNGSA